MLKLNVISWNEICVGYQHHIMSFHSYSERFIFFYYKIQSENFKIDFKNQINNRELLYSSVIIENSLYPTEKCFKNMENKNQKGIKITINLNLKL